RHHQTGSEPELRETGGDALVGRGVQTPHPAQAHHADADVAHGCSFAAVRGAGTSADGPIGRWVDAGRRPCGAGSVPAELLEDPLAHPDVDRVGVLLPAEHAHRDRAVVLALTQVGEGVVPVDLPIADLVVLVDAGIDPGRVHDVPVADIGGVVEDIGDVQVLQPVTGVVHHLAG